jgi:glycosyltransferase involved in cell wall biosynthesis
MDEKSEIVVVIPCFNEAGAIEKVVSNFKKVIPFAVIHVFDNGSTDDSVQRAESAGATIHKVSKTGKGNVVRAMFRDIEADFYIMVDGDGTYPADKAPEMLNLMIDNKADMIVGNRLKSYGASGSRVGHFIGNNLLTNTVNYLFDSNYVDLLSGYRVLSKRFVKSIPLFSKGFEVETVMSIHAVDVDAKVLSIDIDYQEREAGTESKLNTVRDGIRIATTILNLFRDHYPRLFYGFFSILFILLGLIVGIPVVIEFFETGLVPRFPSAILASGLVILSFLTGFTGIILSSISKSRREIKKLAFLSMN